MSRPRLGIIVLISFALSWTAAACDRTAARERRTVEELQQTCRDWMQTYAQESGDDGELKDAKVKEYPPGRYFKETWGLDNFHWVDVRRTDSLINPYTGMAVYTLNHYRTGGQLAREQAETDNEFIVEPIRRITKEYAYRDGQWVVTDAYSQSIGVNALGGQNYGSPEQYGKGNYRYMYDK